MPVIVGSESPRLSIILTTRNDALQLPSSLEKIASYLTENDLDAEVVVVDNGVASGTGDIVRKFATQHQSLAVQLISEPELEEFAAIRLGIWQGTGDIKFLCAAPRRIKTLKTFLKRMAQRRDIASGAAARRAGARIRRGWMNYLFHGHEKFV